MSRPFIVEPHRLALTIAYRNRKLIADSVLPRIPVGNERFSWNKFETAQVTTVPDTEVSRKGLTNEVEFQSTEQTDKTVDHGLETAVPQGDIDNAPENYDPLDNAVESTTDLILLAREIRTATTVFDPTNYSHKDTVANGNKFDNPDADLLGYLLEMLDDPLVRPNTFTLGRREWTKLRRNKALVKAIHGNSGDSGAITTAQLAELLELDNVFVGEAFLNSAKKGKTPQHQKVWQGHASFTYLDALANADNGRLTFGFTAQHKDRAYKEWDDPDIGVDGGQRVRVYEKVKELIVAPDCGFLLQDVLGFKPA
ncbi:TPA: phage capsid protein [Vibrio parahaemolyticus]|nr:phage capsid protein [Vibrio parahaemolyticus]HAS3062102.1 phage capsid protein [Vibrio parahaemolyticus]